MEKVCKVEKVRSTFYTFHDYLNFYGEKKDDRLFTIYIQSTTIRIKKPMIVEMGTVKKLLFHPLVKLISTYL